MVLGTVSDAAGPSSRIGNKWGSLRVAFAVLGDTIADSKRKDKRNHLERLARNPVIQTKLRELWDNLTFSKEDDRIDFSGYKAMCKVLASVVGVQCKDVSGATILAALSFLPQLPPTSHTLRYDRNGSKRTGRTTPAIPSSSMKRDIKRQCWNCASYMPKKETSSATWSSSEAL